MENISLSFYDLIVSIVGPLPSELFFVYGIGCILLIFVVLMFVYGTWYMILDIFR